MIPGERCFPALTVFALGLTCTFGLLACDRPAEPDSPAVGNAFEAPNSGIDAQPNSAPSAWGHQPDFFTLARVWGMPEPGPEEESSPRSVFLSIAPASNPEWINFAAHYNGPFAKSCEFRGQALRMSESLWYGAVRVEPFASQVRLSRRMFRLGTPTFDFDYSGGGCLVRIEMAGGIATFSPLWFPVDSGRFLNYCRAFCGVGMSARTQEFDVSTTPIRAYEFNWQFRNYSKFERQCDENYIEVHFPTPP